jgi:hypothetical protein
VQQRGRKKVRPTLELSLNRRQLSIESSRSAALPSGAAKC